MGDNQNKIYLIILIFLITIFHAIILALHNIGIRIHYNLLTLLCLIALAPLIFAKCKHALSPSRLLALSIIIFILSRPVISLFYDVEIIEVGNKISNDYIFNTISFILTCILMISAFATISDACMAKKSAMIICRNRKLRIKLINIKIISCILLSFSIIFGIAFVYSSFEAFKNLSASDYLSFISDPHSIKHFKYFFISKLAGLLWLFLNFSEKKIVLYTLYLAIMSIGFIIIGLRGYFFIYLILFIFTLSLYSKLSIKFYLIFSVSLVLLAGYALESRLGFVIYENIFERLIMPFYQQGATIEVVYGAVAFEKELQRNLSLINYFFGQEPFGIYVDNVRGVDFEYGGFGSSFFAEIHYMGNLAIIVFCFLVGLVVMVLNKIVDEVVSKKTTYTSVLIVISVIPNLVYIGRSSAFDFLTNFIQILIIVFILTKTSKESPEYVTSMRNRIQ